MSSEAQWALFTYKVSSITHRSDFTSSNMEIFSDAANQTIQDRLGMYFSRPTGDLTVPDDPIMTNHSNWWIYGALVAAYEYIKEIDMALYYKQRWEAELDRYLVTSPDGSTGVLVMGEPIEAPVAADVPDDDWILANGYWNDNGIWVDSSPWVD